VFVEEEMSIRAVTVGLAMFAMAASADAQCRTELKPTDGFADLSIILKCLNDEITALKAGRGAAAPTSAQQPKAGFIAVQTPSGPMSGSVGPLKFDITECRLKGTTVTCVVAVTAEKDAVLNVEKHASHVFDDSGDRRNAKAFRGKNLKEHSGAWYQEYTAGVALINEIDFPDVGPDTQVLARVVIGFSTGGSWEYKTFRNVALVR
jgi:hypothetical protein